MAAPMVRVEHVSHAFRRTGAPPLQTLRDVSFTVEPGQFASLVGPSGCGKTTLLRMLAGLEAQSSGTIEVAGRRQGQLLGASGYMPQRDLLMPWRTVLDNTTLALEFAGVTRAEARRRATTLIPTFGLEGFEHAHPATLSGGMRQRVSLLRTVLAGRDVLLLDEPFGALDAIIRSDLHEWLGNLVAGMGATVVLVTHDLEEAAYLSDRVHVMSNRPGRILSSVCVPLPRPRSYEVTASDEFSAIKRTLVAALRAARHGTAAVEGSRP